MSKLNNLTIRPFSPKDLEAVIELYRACFAEPPWYESFDSRELAAKFAVITSWNDATFFVATLDEMIVGGTIGFDFRRKDDLKSLVPTDNDSCFYLSELFVAAGMRKQGIAEALMRKRFAFARDRGYTKAVVRTSIKQFIIRSIYERLGFQIVARQEVASTKMMNGAPATASDQRVILAGSIPQLLK